MSHLLAIDVGNTHTLAGVFEGETLLHEWRISTNRGSTEDELAAAHDQILRLRGGSLDDLDSMIVASVVPALTAGYRALGARYMDRPALVVGPGVRTGMPLAIDNPRELGADRLVNAVAAYRRFGGPCIVVDLGTATPALAHGDHAIASLENAAGDVAGFLARQVVGLASMFDRVLWVTLQPFSVGAQHHRAVSVDGEQQRLCGGLGSHSHWRASRWPAVCDVHLFGISGKADVLVRLLITG